jgi:flagellar basal body-associated protein FliL
MQKEKLANLFEKYDPAIKAIILEVLKVEQANISMEKPRVKDEIDTIVSNVTASELAKTTDES